MNVKFCLVNDSDNVINKEIVDSQDVNLVIRKDFDVINPILYIRDNETFSIKDFNYINFFDLNRKYFIKSVENLGNKLFKVECGCDVIETFKNDILNSNASFNRNIKTGDYDNISVIETSNKTITRYTNDVSLENQSSMIMTTIGEG